MTTLWANSHFPLARAARAMLAAVMPALLPLVFVALASSLAMAQGVLVIVNHPHPIPLPRPMPTPPSPPTMSYKIKELAYTAKVVDQIAQVQVTQSFVNTGSQQMEVSLVFPLPYDGAIDRMTFLVDGKEYDAKLLEAKKAREIYEGYVRRSQDPALLEWVGRGMFQTSVFPVPPGAERKVTIRFSQLLRQEHRLTDLLIPMATARYTNTPIEKVSLEATIESSIAIKSVYSPTHAVDVKRPDEKHATVKFEASNYLPTTDFRLLYDVGDAPLAASVLSYRPDNSDEGFFLMLASPNHSQGEVDLTKKTVIFVVDRSGSMQGKKIEQAREAMRYVLNNLHEGDTFNIVAYDSTVESFKPELQKFDDATRKSALAYVDGLYAGGSTNISGALDSAFAMLTGSDRPNYILFLTDGLPTAGETNEGKIVELAKQKNVHRARMINFGVGYDVNSRLLDRMSRENFGQSQYVRPDENLEASVSRLYSKMSSPVLTDVKVSIDIEGAGDSSSAVNRMYPKQVMDIFSGEQLVIAGRYKKSGNAKITLSGKLKGEDKKFDFPASFVEKSIDQTHGFVEKLWAMRRIGEIIDEIDLKGMNDELVKELVALSTKHGILTPYTSFLADDQAKPSELADSRRNLDRANLSLKQLDQAGGQSGFAQRAEKKQLQEAAGVPYAAGPASANARGADGLALGGGGGAARFRNVETDEEVTASAVQNAGNSTLYRRGKLWIADNATDVCEEKDAAKIKKIKRFSDEYFKLVSENTADENAILATQQAGEELLVKLRGQAYQIE
ncbi:von Willebrand factor type A [Pirellula staleyi DSM 6068]|uniref:von Willebrand factor type A n=1 Tax=Pirellula staleyi (strain ATCC 27377 / DSM 6068 / ICPB 4128) TaxID=530564 RepID=D2R2I7_PIRSD|nr:VIT domain-containing protein [Pirellula staleyi]ADB15096.1 von Willebrand factor type A [Pirellula staleyi DSM 6068]